MKNIESRRVLATTLAVLLFSTSGCSLIFVKPPSSTGHVAGPRRECTSSKLAPVLDTLFTGAQVARTAFAVGADDSVYDDPAQPLSRGADVGLGLGFTALFLGSAIYGYVNTSKCSKGSREPSDDDDLSPERWTSPTRQAPARSAQQPVEAPPSAPSSNAAVDQPPTTDQPGESNVPASALPSPGTPPPEPNATRP
jgi:hypothetical protein